jgi:hypothetical protein
MITGPPPKFHGTTTVVSTALEARKWGRGGRLGRRRIPNLVL